MKEWTKKELRKKEKEMDERGPTKYYHSWPHGINAMKNEIAKLKRGETNEKAVHREGTS